MTLRPKSSTLSALAGILAAVVAAVLASSRPASAQARYEVVHAFPGPGPIHPYASLTLGTDGNFYGTTNSGGTTDRGMIFKMTPGGSLTFLHGFAGVTDGAHPYAALTQAIDGNFYGTTVNGGGGGIGTVFRMTPAGNVTILHTFFGDPDGSYPYGAVVQAAGGTFYGTTSRGGDSGLGTVFSMTPLGVTTILHSFIGGADGATPYAGLIQATDGNFYGTTTAGGDSDAGTVFRMTPAGVVTVLHSFADYPLDGASPNAALIQAADGSLYGTTPYGGSSGGGTVFKITLAGTLTILHQFDHGANGGTPVASLLQTPDGNFYGTTTTGGGSNAGTVFTMTPAGAVTPVHLFNKTDGSHPYGAVVRAADGSFYGTTLDGGAFDTGTIFRVTSGGAFIVLQTFVGGPEGTRPDAPLIQAADGNFYGTTLTGGTNDLGTVFKITPAGTVTVLHSFADNGDGFFILSALVQASDGNLYGTAAVRSVIFKITPGGTFTVLHTLTATEGSNPSTLIQAADGNLYGTTQHSGASGHGTAFRMTPAGVFTVMHAFTGSPADGGGSVAALVQANDGNFYGTTISGGASNFGTIFKMAPDGVVTILHSFSGGADGQHSYAPLIQAADGDLYGTTYVGGTSNSGTAFKTSLTGSTYTVLHSFAGPDGAYPYTPLVQGSDRNFYGTTAYGGDNGLGTVFKMTPSGSVVVLHKFTGADGANPFGGLVRTNGLNFYGTTYAGGAFGLGVVFHLSIPSQVGDFDGDAKPDIAVYRPSTGNWHVLQSSTNNTTSTSFAWGLSTDVPVPGDYDGDGKTDPAIFRPSTGLWAVLKSSTNYTTSFTVSWGLSTDVPMVGDYDGDDKTDPAIYRPSTGLWAILKSSAGYGSAIYVSWGLSTDTPLAADYDGDGKTDPAIFRPSTGLWALLKSSSGYASATYVTLGVSTDVAVPGDYDGDGKADPAIFRPSTGVWSALKSSTTYATSLNVSWGLSTDVPVPADFDGDGKTDPAIFRPSTGLWAILKSSTGYGSSIVVSWGLSTDTPLYRRP